MELTKEEANAKLAELVNEIQTKLKEAEEFATQHLLSFSISTDSLTEQGDDIRFIAEKNRWYEKYPDEEPEVIARYKGGWNSSSCW